MLRLDFFIWIAAMEMPQLVVLAGVFFLGQVAFEINRRVSSSPFGRAIRATSDLRAMWDFIAIIAILGGISLFVFGLINWIWWKSILLWVGMGLVGSVFGKMLWRRDEEALVKIERAIHLSMVICAAGQWAIYFTHHPQALP